MNDLELMDALRTARRVDDTTIATVTDRHALNALREGITMTDRHTPPTVEAPRRGRRLGRRGLTAGALGVVLVGGGVAYAATHWDRGPLIDGLTCARSVAVTDGWLEVSGAATGRSVTGDDVADCAAIRADAGLPALADPVAVQLQGSRFVVSRDGLSAEVLAAATPSTPDADRAARLELDSALGDWVDGPQGGCFSAAEARSYATSSLARAGLSEWPVRVAAAPGGADAGPCAGVEVGAAGRSVVVTPEARRPVERGTPDVADSVIDLSESLRSRLDGQCLTLADAESTVRRTAGTATRVATVADESLDCADVDMVVGGDVQLTVRGPAVARP
ncbi:hypothetical protein G7075_04630 [Phycicoccus sp. HDW14]|uniref:hypothetical protein n=1 Tax=Phycicoccus sp. HDW14 TaxID=2714941 RepID=UPI00140C8221|nr:hypothetical protein [Phycicoccus sp. HDW14]QIM20599.1 hypothetical protein G7075_04630 [Phycicoccus sp. HDW14]